MPLPEILAFLSCNSYVGEVCVLLLIWSTGLTSLLFGHDTGIYCELMRTEVRFFVVLVSVLPGYKKDCLYTIDSAISSEAKSVSM